MLFRPRLDKISAVIQPALAGLILLVCVSVANNALAAGAIYTVGLTSGRPAFGNLVASSTGTTTFTETAGGSITVTAGSGGFDPPAGSRSVSAQTITISCSNNKTNCNGNDVAITVTATAPGTRITAVRMSASGGNATFRSGGTTSGSSSLSFSIGPIGNSSSKTFNLGMEIDVVNSGSTTAYTIPYSVTATGVSGDTNGTNSTSGSATVYRGLSVSSSQPLNFGSIVANSGGTVALNALGTARAVTGGVVKVNSQTADPVQPAIFTIGGEVGTNVTLAFSTVALTGPGTTMAFTQNSSLVGTITLSSSSQSLTVGGTVTVGANQTPGTYNGQVILTVTYN